MIESVVLYKLTLFKENSTFFNWNVNEDILCKYCGMKQKRIFFCFTDVLKAF